LAAIADHRDLLGFDQIEIGVSIIIHTHVLSQSSRNAALRK
jgi:hypothetical protein